MPPQLTQQLERLSYTRRDLELIDAEVDRFITSFIPVIKNTGRANVGRLFLRVLEALVDKLNYSMDMRFRQSVLRTVTELQAAIDITDVTRYQPAGTSSARADLDVSTLTGPAPAGGISIPQYSIINSDTAPVKQFLTLEAATVPEGATTFSPLQVIEGTRVVDQVIRASAVGEPHEEVPMPVAKTPHEFLEIKVDGVEFEQRADLKDSEPEDRHFTIRDDEDRFTTIVFGDGEFGVKLQPGSVVTSTYIQSLGLDGNTPSGRIVAVAGTLSSQIAVTNPEPATGGFDGDIVDDIVRKAPKLASSARGALTSGADFYRAGNNEDFEALAEALVSGVFRALSDQGVGPVVNLFILPAGGGIAPSSILDDVEEKLAPRLIHGVTLNAKSLRSAHILIRMNVALRSNRVNKSVARRRIFETISAFKSDGSVNQDGALFFRNLTIGRGFALSDMSSLIERIDDGELVDFVDYLTFTRYPTPIAANLATTVFFDGEIVPLSPADYDDWSITPTTATTFALFKNGVIDSNGTIGVTHTSADGSIRFTLGETTDTFDTSLDGWTFSTSAFRNNMRLSRFEFMELARDNDLQITVFFPGELVIGE